MIRCLQFICLAFYQKEMALYVRANLDRWGWCWVSANVNEAARHCWLWLRLRLWR